MAKLVTKKFYVSKTVIVGVIEIVMGVLGLVATFLEKGDFAAPSIVLLVVGALGIVLRWLTDTRISL